MTCVRGEVVPPHGEVIRTDARFRAGTVPETAILVKHGFKGFKDWGFFPHLCDRLARAGHLVVSYNGSRNGIGPGLLDFTDLDAFSRNTISHEVDDLHWMADRLLAGEWSGGRRPRAAGLLGHSRGGASSVIVASERDDIASLATWAAISTFHRWTPEQEAEWERNGVIHVQNARTGQDMPLLLDLRDDLKENRDRLDVAAAASRVKGSLARGARHRRRDRAPGRGAAPGTVRPDRFAGGDPQLRSRLRGRAPVRIRASRAEGRHRGHLAPLRRHPNFVHGPPHYQVGAFRTRGTVTYIITEPCIGTKDASCVEVCPVDCIYETDDQYLIHPDECIDCGACEPECPVQAIFPDTDVPSEWSDYIEKNAVHFE